MSSLSPTGAGRDSRKKTPSWSSFAWVLCLLCLVSVVFGPSLRYKFQGYDDLEHVRNNPYLQPLTWSRIWYFWRYPFNSDPVPGVPISNVGLDEPYHVIYTPLSFTVHALVALPARTNSGVREATESLATLDPSWYHGFNILLHTINVLLLFFLLRELMRSDVAAGVGALFFAIHPVQVEPVCWITGQNNLLSTAFGLLALWLYLSPLKRRDLNSSWASTSGGEEDPRRGRVRYYLSVFFFVCSILSKPTTAVWPAVALMLDFAFFQRSTLRRCLAVAPWFGVSLISAIINKSLQTYTTGDIAIALQNRPFVIGDAFLFYMKQVIWPPFLVPDYGRKPSVVLSDPWVHVEWIVPAVVPVVLWITRRRITTEAGRQCWLAAATGLATFFLILLPTSGLITYYFHAYSTVADRYLYLAMTGVALSIAGGVAFVQRNISRSPQTRTPSWAMAACGGLYLVLLTAKSIGQAPVWTNDAVLWEHVLAHNPRSWIAWLNRGQAAQAQGHDEEAIEDVMRARDIEPNNWLIRQSLGSTFYLAKKLDEAAAEYRLSLQLNPTNSFINLRLGLIAIQKGQLYAAAKFLNRGLALAPNNPVLLANFGTTLCKLGHLEEGESYLQEAMRRGFDPAVTNLYIGVAEAQRGNLDAAMKYFRRSLELNPDYYETHYNYGLALEKTGKLDAAMSEFQDVMRLQPKYVPAYTGLARIFIAKGHPESAKDPLNDALGFKPDDPEAKRLMAKVNATP